LIAGLAALLFCSDVLHHVDHWGFHDWGIFYFHNISVYRSIVEFGEAPLWNPWCLGGMPLLANPQTLAPDPWFGLDLVFGPIFAIRLKIVAHYALGLEGAYWCARQFRLTQLAAFYFAGTFIFSTWLALHLQAGHLSFLCGIYIPWVVGFLQRSQARFAQALYGSMLLALMAFQGGVFVLIFTGFVTGLLAIGWSIQKRSLWPVAALFVMWACFLGLSAVKLMPACELMGKAPRLAATDVDQKIRPVVGGRMWSKYKSLLLGTKTDAEPDSARSRTERAEENARVPVHQSTKPTPSSPKTLKRSKWDMPAVLVKVFLGREQRSLEIYYAIQGFGWHEYGAYLGPLAILLMLSSLFFLRSAWPWMLVGVVCFLVAVGNFAPFAPWTVLHRLPVLSNMRAPCRFLIPCAFAGSMLASMALDELLSRFGTPTRAGAVSPSQARRKWITWLALVCVVLALVDSFLVGRHSLQGAFPSPQPPLAPRLPSIITVKKWEDEGGQTAAMLANYCVVLADEAIPVPVMVTPQGGPDYLGEYYFVSEAASESSRGSQVELLNWSPNTVRVRVTASHPGHVVLNRNWDQGWVVDPPYQVTSYHGLIASEVGTGNHTIRFAYQPSMVRIGLAISLCSLITVMAALARSHRVHGPTHPPEHASTTA